MPTSPSGMYRIAGDTAQVVIVEVAVIGSGR